MGRKGKKEHIKEKKKKERKREKITGMFFLAIPVVGNLPLSLLLLILFQYTHVGVVYGTEEVKRYEFNYVTHIFIYI